MFATEFEMDAKDVEEEVKKGSGLAFSLVKHNGAWIKRCTWGADTMASISTCDELIYFETIDWTRKGTVDTLEGKASYEAFGIIAIRFDNSSRVYRFPAYYTPRAKVKLLCNAALYRAGISTCHDPEDPHLILTKEGGRRIPMVIHSTTRIFVPPPKSFLASTLDNKPDAQLWHERTMHMSIDYLRGMGLQVPAGGLDYCNTCVQVKAKRYQPKLDPEMRQ